MASVSLRVSTAAPALGTMLWLAACGGLAPPPRALPAAARAPETGDAALRHASSSGGGDAPTTAGNRATFDRLLAEVRRSHVFAPQTEKNLGRRWEDEVPELTLEFERANTRAKLSVALEHFVNALHNPHCYFQPVQRGERLTLGFDVNAEWKGDAPTFRVWKIDDVALRGSLAEGDVVRSVDGVGADAFLRAHLSVSNANNRRGVARDIAHWLTGRSTSRALVTEGQTSEWILANRDGTTKAVKVTWKPRADKGWSDYRLDYESEGCAGLPARHYGSSYELAFTGAKYCIYASKRAPFRDFPIVRHFSFAYSDSDWQPSPTWFAHVDQRNLKAQLASLSAKGVIVDLRDNSGGNNPNWFLDWWAPAGWTDARVRMRLDEQLMDSATRQRAGVDLGDGNGAWYAAQLAARSKGQDLTAPRPFFCKPGPASDPDARDCAWDNRYVPAHRVTQAPVALLVGPGCVSSCDSVARQFDENDFGPLIGEPTAAGYTTQRMKLPVTDAAFAEVGAIRLAISTEVSGLTGRDIEAVPLHLDIPLDRTFDNRDLYDATLVDAATTKLRPKAP